MVYKKDSWIAAYTKAVKDLNTEKPTSGLPCAVATLRYVRDGILDDIAQLKDKKLQADITLYVKDSINALVAALAKAGGVDDGFASNASAAAKAAGFKSEAEKIVALAE